jgi:hypothetical protein
LLIAPRWTGRIYNEPAIAWLPAEQAPAPVMIVPPMNDFIKKLDEEKDSNLQAIDRAFSDLNESLNPVWKAW